MSVDSRVVCTVCQKEQFVNFRVSLRNGWPKCHGYTMRLEQTTADIDKAVGGAISDQLAPLGSAVQQLAKPE